MAKQGSHQPFVIIWCVYFLDSASKNEICFKIWTSKKLISSHKKSSPSIEIENMSIQTFHSPPLKFSGSAADHRTIFVSLVALF